jgi:hypothetical protein
LKWQEFLLCHGTEIELESGIWLDDVLHHSIEKTLHSEVQSDLKGIPPTHRSSITTLQCIIKCMVVKNQEAHIALETYIKTFNFTNSPGENVSTACLCLKTVAKALGDKDLPMNTIQKISKALLNDQQTCSMMSVQAKLLCNVAASIKPSWRLLFSNSHTTVS